MPKESTENGNVRNKESQQCWTHTVGWTKALISFVT